jgi:succinate dehydrogenase/fumarate reductase-like Fe-S protein
MLIKTYRYDPDNSLAPHFQEFDVPARADWSVMDVLDYIAVHFDSSLAYYRHSACDHGICGRCTLKVNGKNTLACTCQVGNETELTLEPKNEEVVRDLVTI